METEDLIQCRTVFIIIWPHPQAALKEVAENGMKQYLKSRNQPSPESVTRAKKLNTTLIEHPLFGTPASYYIQCTKSEHPMLSIYKNYVHVLLTLLSIFTYKILDLKWL